MTWKYLRQYLDANHTSYQDYLASEHWQDVRRRFWASKLHRGKCFCCGTDKKPLEVHHKTYKRIGHERLGDLALLCRDCHQAAHNFEKNGTTGGFRGTRLWGSVKHVARLVKLTGSPKGGKFLKRYATFTEKNLPGYNHKKDW